MALTDRTAGTRLTTQTQLIDAINSQRRFPVNDQLYELVSNESPFLNLLRKISKVSINGPEKQFYEHRSAFLNTQIGYFKANGTIAADSDIGDSVTLDITTTSDGSTYCGSTYLRAGDIVQVVDADDKSLVCSVLLVSLSTNTWTGYCLTQDPGFVPSTADGVYLVGNAFGEDGAFTTGSYTKVQTRWFTSQIFKDMVSYSRTLEKSTDIAYGSEADRLLREAIQNHFVSIDRALLYGSGRQTLAAATSGATERDPFASPVNEMVDASSKYIRTSASFLQVMRATSNRDVSLETQLHEITMSGMTWSDLLDDFEVQFRYGSEVKEAICGRGVVSFFNRLAMTNHDYQLRVGENAYGIKIYKLITPHGEINLKPSRGMLEGGYNYAMAVIDPANISVAEFDPTSWAGLPKTRDGKDIEILTDCGLWVRKPETHGWWWFK